MADRPLTVGRLTRRISDQLADFGPLLVQGELSQVKVSAAGHCYMTLKDPDAVLSVVMWRGVLAGQGRVPEEGTKVVVRGSLSVYGPRGQYQLQATRITAQGAGDLAARFEALKQALQREGLFDDERKQALPLLPAGLGIATAAGSAALADLLHGVAERFPSMPVYHAPCRVQGDGAAATIVAALHRLDRHPGVGVIVVGRGGGSLEDLWPFNEEAVVRAIVACRTPVVSAVGHESDTSLADLAADRRTKTPTAAIEACLPEEAALWEDLSESAGILHEAIARRLADERRRLAALATHRALSGPAFQLKLRRQRLDALATSLVERAGARVAAARSRLEDGTRHLRILDPRIRVQGLRQRLGHDARALRRAGDNRLRRVEDRFARLTATLDAYSPLGVIARGYSVVRTAEGQVVRKLAQAPRGTAIRARLEDGWLDAEVTGGEQRRLREASDLYKG